MKGLSQSGRRGARGRQHEAPRFVPTRFVPPRGPSLASRRENRTALSRSAFLGARAPAGIGRWDGGRGGGRRGATILLSTGRGKQSPPWTGGGRRRASQKQKPRRSGPVGPGPASPRCPPPRDGGAPCPAPKVPARMPRGVLGGVFHSNTSGWRIPEERGAPLCLTAVARLPVL